MREEVLNICYFHLISCRNQDNIFNECFAYVTKNTVVYMSIFYISSVQSLSRVWLFAPCTPSPHLRHGLEHARLPCPSPTPAAYSNSCPLSQWCYPTILSSDVPFSSRLQSFPAPGSFQMSHFFAASGQSIGVSASASVLPMNSQDWFPLGWTGWISLLSKGLSRVFSNTILQKHRFFGAQLSLYSNSHIHTLLLDKLYLGTIWTFVSKVTSLLFNTLSR